MFPYPAAKQENFATTEGICHSSILNAVNFCVPSFSLYPIFPCFFSFSFLSSLYPLYQIF